jgi:acylglycerol lipase
MIIMVHGLNCHSAYPRQVIDGLVSNGIAVSSIDLEGFGRSSGCHGYLHSYISIVEDLYIFLELMHSQHPHRKLFIMGISLGGALSILLALKLQRESSNLPIRGIVLQSPCVDFVRPTDLVQWVGLRVNMLFPKLPFLQSSKTRGIAKDSIERVVLEDMHDPLRYNGSVRVSTAVTVFEITEAIKRERKRFAMPYLLQHGEDDEICQIGGSLIFHEDTASDDKTFTRYKGANHSMWNELPERVAEIQLECVTWIRTRM